MMLRFLRFRTNVRNSYILAFYAESHNKYHVQIKTGGGHQKFLCPIPLFMIRNNKQVVKSSYFSSFKFSNFKIGLRAAVVSSKRSIIVVCGASNTLSGSSSASFAIWIKASQK